MQTTMRRWPSFVAGIVSGVALSCMAVRMADAQVRRDDTLRRFTADVDLDALYAFKHKDGTNARNKQLSSTLKAGSKFRIRMKKGSLSYLELHTVMPTESLEQISEPSPEE